MKKIYYPYEKSPKRCVAEVTENGFNIVRFRYILEEDNAVEILKKLRETPAESVNRYLNQQTMEATACSKEFGTDAAFESEILNVVYVGNTEYIVSGIPTKIAKVDFLSYHELVQYLDGCPFDVGLAQVVKEGE